MGVGAEFITLGNYRTLVNRNQYPLTYSVFDKVSRDLTNRLQSDPELSRLHGLVKGLHLDLLTIDLSDEEDRLNFNDQEGSLVDNRYSVVYTHSNGFDTTIYTVSVNVIDKKTRIVYYKKPLSSNMIGTLRNDLISRKLSTFLLGDE